MINGTRRGWGVSVTHRPLFIPGKDPVPIVQEAGLAPGPVWTGVENLAQSGFDPRTVQPVACSYTEYATRPTPDVEWYRKISPPPGFDPRTVQPVASRYTDYSTRPTPDVEWYRKTLYERRKFVIFVTCGRDLRCWYDPPSGHALS